MPTANEERAVQALRQLAPARDAAEVEQWLGGLRRRQRRRRVARLALGGLSLAAAVALAVGLWPGARELERAEVARNAPVVTLTDGSTIERGPDTRLSVDETGSGEVRVTLSSGKLRATVTPRRGREFAVVAGAVRVVVVGTRFEVERLGERVRVRVEHGVVHVLRPGHPDAQLNAGEERSFPEPPAAPASSREVPAGGHDVPMLDEVAPALSAEPKELAAGGDWRSFAHRGVYAEAYRLIERGGARAVRDEVGDLLLAADAARLSGHSAAALPFLSRVLASHSKDARAPMAAFTQGRLLLNLGRPAEAAAAFERALAVGAQGSLRENALARAVESRGRAGDGARAASLAQTYMREYPRGRWLASVRAYGGLDE